MIPSNKEKEIYSTEEVRVGTWIDGKPLYRKVIQDTVPTTTSAGTFVGKSISIEENVDLSFVEYGFVTDFINDIIPLNNTSSAGYKVQAKTNNNGNLVISSNNSALNGIAVIVSVKYTKTTD